MALGTLNFEGLVDRDGEFTPELELWCEVMLVGIQDAAIAMHKGEVRCEPIRWFSSDDYRPGSFTWLCCLFNTQPEIVREKVISDVKGFTVQRRVSRIRKQYDRD